MGYIHHVANAIWQWVSFRHWLSQLNDGFHSLPGYRKFHLDYIDFLATQNRNGFHLIIGYRNFILGFIQRMAIPS